MKSSLVDTRDENWHRLYDSTVGRYLRVDPMLQDSASYRYAANTPLVFSDPRGLDVVIKYSPSLDVGIVLVDKWDSTTCCSKTGSESRSFGPPIGLSPNVKHHGHWNPHSNPVPLGPWAYPTGASPYWYEWHFCTSCEEDGQILKWMDNTFTRYYSWGGQPGTWTGKSFIEDALGAGTQLGKPTLTLNDPQCGKHFDLPTCVGCE